MRPTPLDELGAGDADSVNTPSRNLHQQDWPASARLRRVEALALIIFHGIGPTRPWTHSLEEMSILLPGGNT